MATNEIEILVKAEVTKALSNLKAVSDASNKIKKDNEDLFEKLKKGYGLIAGILTGAVATALALVTKKGAEFLDLNDSFLQTFAGIEKAANDMRNSLVDAYGFSTTEATKLLTTNGGLFESLGLTTAQSLEYAGAVAKLAAAQGDFNGKGLDATQVNDIIATGLAGRTQGLKELNIIIDDNKIKLEAQSRGLLDVNGNLSKQAKAQLVLEEATKQSSVAIAQFEAKGGSLLEKSNRLKKGIDDLTTAFGIELASSFLGGKNAITDFLTQANRLEVFQKIARKTIDVVIAYASILVLPFEVTARTIATLVTQIAQATQNIGTAFNFLKEGRFSDFADTMKVIGVNAAKAFVSPFTSIADTIQSDIKKVANIFTSTERDISKDSQGNAQQRVIVNKAANEQIIVDEKKAADARKAIDDFLVKDKEDSQRLSLDRQYKAAIDGATLLGESTLAIEAQYIQAKEKLETEANIRRVKAAIDTAQAIGSAASAVGDLIVQLVTNQADEEIKQGKITEEEKKKRLKDAAIVQKGIAIFNAVINTASAVVAALATPFIGPAIAIAAGITGAAQTALIAATPIPEFAEGGLVTGPFPAMVGHGTEAILPAELTSLLMNAAGVGGGSSTTNNDNKHVTYVANGITDPVAFINRVQRINGDQAFGGAR